MGSAPGMVRESFKKRREQGTGIIHGPDTPSVQGLKPDPKAGIASWQIIPFIKPNILVILLSVFICFVKTFPHKICHSKTWLSPDGILRNSKPVKSELHAHTELGHGDAAAPWGGRAHGGGQVRQGWMRKES